MDVEQIRARRLLSHGAAAPATVAGPAGQVVEHRGGGVGRGAPFSSLDATVITVLSLLLCVLVVSLLLHAVVRCACRVTRRVCYGAEETSWPAPPEIRAAAGPRRKRGGACWGQLPTPQVYSAGIELAGCGSTECAICLAAFAQGERVRVLPRCNHGFHVRCIDRWLAARQTCPTCRREPFAMSAPPSPPTRAEAPADAQAHVGDGGQHVPL